MSWRTVVISRRCKLDMSLGYMEVRGEELRKIHLSEIGMLIVESTGLSHGGAAVRTDPSEGKGDLLR